MWCLRIEMIHYYRRRFKWSLKWDMWFQHTIISYVEFPHEIYLTFHEIRNFTDIPYKYFERIFFSIRLHTMFGHKETYSVSTINSVLHIICISNLAEGVTHFINLYMLVYSFHRTEYRNILGRVRRGCHISRATRFHCNCTNKWCKLYLAAFGIDY
jgi:hypothetical protein